MNDISTVASQAEKMKALKSLLTEQQFNVLTHIAEGKLNKQIARDLDYAEITVKAHASAILKGLSTSNRTFAALRYVEAGGEVTSRPKKIAEITQKEQEVLTKIAQGQTIAQMASDMHISEITIKKHTTHLMRKYGAHNRTQLAVWYTILGEDMLAPQKTKPKKPVETVSAIDATHLAAE